MAQTVFCDWCGERLEISDSDMPLELRAQGTSGDGFVFKSLGLHYHAGQGNDDCCLAHVLRLLEERAEWAHDPDQERLEWRLLPRTDPRAGSPVSDEWSERVGRGTALYSLGLPVQAENGLRSANVVTLEEAAGRSEAEIRAVCGVGPHTVQLLESKMQEHGLTWAVA